MVILVTGGTGFMGVRIVRLLAARGHMVVCMDVAPDEAAFADLGETVSLLRGDVTTFDEVMAAMVAARPARVIHLPCLLGSAHAPHRAVQVNIMGLDNCLEAARLCAVPHVVYASSLAVNGAQSHYGDHAITEDDARHGCVQYAVHKMFNEWQAQDYREKYGMTITGIRPASVTGPDKVRGALDHVTCITEPARGRAVSLPFRDAMRCIIHVDDVAEVFATVALADQPRHALYNTGGAVLSMGDLASIVRSHLPEARIEFARETGGAAGSENYRIDNSRLLTEFSIGYRSINDRVGHIIAEVRAREGLAVYEPHAKTGPEAAS